MGGKGGTGARPTHEDVRITPRHAPRHDPTRITPHDTITRPQHPHEGGRVPTDPNERGSVATERMPRQFWSKTQHFNLFSTQITSISANFGPNFTYIRHFTHDLREFWAIFTYIRHLPGVLRYFGPKFHKYEQFWPKINTNYTILVQNLHIYACGTPPAHPQHIRTLTLTLAPRTLDIRPKSHPNVPRTQHTSRYSYKFYQ